MTLGSLGSLGIKKPEDLRRALRPDLLRKRVTELVPSGVARVAQKEDARKHLLEAGRQGLNRIVNRLSPEEASKAREEEERDSRRQGQETGAGSRETQQAGGTGGAGAGSVAGTGPGAGQADEQQKEQGEQAPEEAPGGDRAAEAEQTETKASGEPGGPAGEQQASGEQQPAGEQKPGGEQQASGEQQAAGEQKPGGEQQASGEQQTAGEQKPGGEQQASGEQQTAGEQKPGGEQQASGEQGQKGGEGEKAAGAQKEGKAPGKKGPPKGTGKKKPAAGHHGGPGQQGAAAGAAGAQGVAGLGGTLGGAAGAAGSQATPGLAGTVGQASGASPEMQAWMTSHPDLEARNRILQLATFTEGIRGRTADLKENLPKKTLGDKILNWVGVGDLKKAWKNNPYQVKGLGDIETWLAIIGYVRPALSLVGDVADKVSLITTIASLLTIWFPPVAGPLMAISRIANIVSVVVKAADFALSLIQAGLAAVRIGKEKDPLKRAQMAATMRDGIQSGLMAGVEAITAALGAKASKGAKKGFTGTKNLTKSRNFAGKTMLQKAKAIGKGTATGFKTGLKETFTKKGLKEVGKETLKGLKEKVAPSIREALSENKKTWTKTLKMAATDRKGLVKHVLSETWKNRDAINKDWKKGVDKYMSEQFDETRSAERGASVRAGMAGGGGPQVGGHIQALDNLIAAGLGQAPTAQAGVGPNGDILVPRMAGPTEADVLLQPEDYEGIESQRKALREMKASLDGDIAQQVDYRDHLLKTVAPAAVQGGKEAMEQANAVAEQRAENQADQADLQKSHQATQQVQQANQQATAQGQQAQGEANQDVQVAQRGMAAEPDQSKVDQEAQKKAKEDYEREKREYENSSLIGKAWKSVKKFAKSVASFVGSALKWVWKNIIKAVMDKVKGTIAKVMNYITGKIMQFLLKTMGGMSDSEAKTLAFGAEAQQKQGESAKADEELMGTGKVAMEASDKATKAEKDAIEEANRANENIQNAKGIQQEIQGQEQALDQEEQQGKAREAAFKAQFGPYFASLAGGAGVGGAVGGAGGVGGALSQGAGPSQEPTVSEPMIGRVAAAATAVQANSTQSTNLLAAEAEELKTKELQEKLKGLKASLESQKKANEADRPRGSAAVGAAMGAGVGAVLGGPVGAAVGAGAGATSNPAQMSASDYDRIYDQAAARIRNEAAVWARQVVQEHGSGESQRRSRVAGEAAKAAGLRGQSLAAVEAMLRQVAQGLKAEDEDIPVDREEAKRRLQQGLDHMFS